MLRKARMPYDPKYVLGECRASGARIQNLNVSQPFRDWAHVLANRPSGPGIFAPIDLVFYHAHGRMLARDPSTRTLLIRE